MCARCTSTRSSGVVTQCGSERWERRERDPPRKRMVGEALPIACGWVVEEAACMCNGR